MRLMHLVKLAPRVGPARCQYDVAARGQPLEASIAVDLQHTTEVLEMGSRTLCLAIRTVEVNSCRRIGSAPGPVIAGVDPEPAGLGAAAPGIEHRDRRIVGEQLVRGEDLLGKPGL